MRRLLQHAVIGVSLTAATAAAVVTGFGAPGSDAVLAVPVVAPAATVSASATPAPIRPTANAAAQEKSAADARAAGDPGATTAEQATRRSAALAAQSRSIGQQRTRIEAERRARAAEKKRRAQAKAAAEARAAARAKAAEAERKAAEAERKAAESARKTAAAAKQAADRAAAKRAANERGYEPGTSDPREMARQILRNRFDYGSEQFSCFNNVIIRESQWDVNATNPSSGAYGIPQALPGSKMASAGSDWRTNPATQIIWAVGYMKDRYGSPCAAWSFKSANGWY